MNLLLMNPSEQAKNEVLSGRFRAIVSPKLTVFST